MTSRGDGLDLGPETRFNNLELFCSKVLLKYKRDKASEIVIRRGQKECPLASF